MTATGSAFTGILSTIVILALYAGFVALFIFIGIKITKKLIDYNAEAKAKAFAKYFKESTPARSQNTKTRTEDTDYEAWRAEKLRKEAENSAE